LTIRSSGFATRAIHVGQEPDPLTGAVSVPIYPTSTYVQEEIGTTTRACAYDRAGLGFSDAAERPSDLRNIVDDLHRLVEAAPIATPFVYVGHSLAGAIGLLYVATYPEDIAGAVRYLLSPDSSFVSGQSIMLSGAQM